MAARLSDTDRARMRRQGIPPLSSNEGLSLLDAALQQPDALLAPVRFDLTALSAQADALPSLLRGLVRAPARRSAPANASSSMLQQRLAALSGADRDRALLELVRTEVAAVFGAPPASV